MKDIHIIYYTLFEISFHSKWFCVIMKIMISRSCSKKLESIFFHHTVNRVNVFYWQKKIGLCLFK